MTNFYPHTSGGFIDGAGNYYDTLPAGAIPCPAAGANTDCCKIHYYAADTDFANPDNPTDAEIVAITNGDLNTNVAYNGYVWSVDENGDVMLIESPFDDCCPQHLDAAATEFADPDAPTDAEALTFAGGQTSVYINYNGYVWYVDGNGVIRLIESPMGVVTTLVNVADSDGAVTSTYTNEDGVTTEFCPGLNKFIDHHGNVVAPNCDPAYLHRSLLANEVHAGSVATGQPQFIVADNDSDDAGITGITTIHAYSVNTSQNSTATGTYSRAIAGRNNSVISPWAIVSGDANNLESSRSFLTGRRNTDTAGTSNIGTGFDNVHTNGDNNLFAGKNNVVTDNNNAMNVGSRNILTSVDNGVYGGIDNEYLNSQRGNSVGRDNFADNLSNDWLMTGNDQTADGSFNAVVVGQSGTVLNCSNVFLHSANPVGTPFVCNVAQRHVIADVRMGVDTDAPAEKIEIAGGNLLANGVLYPSDISTKDKKSIKPLDTASALEAVNKLELVKFKWNAEHEGDDVPREHVGVIAQQAVEASEYYVKKETKEVFTEELRQAEFFNRKTGKVELKFDEVTTETPTGKYEEVVAGKRWTGEYTEKGEPVFEDVVNLVEITEITTEQVPVMGYHHDSAGFEETGRLLLDPIHAIWENAGAIQELTKLVVELRAEVEKLKATKK